MPPESALRLTRVTCFTAVREILATAGNAAAAHVAVAPWAIGVGFAGVFIMAWALTGTERSLTANLGGLLGGQFLAPSLFMATHRASGRGAVIHGAMHLKAAAAGPRQGGATMTRLLGGLGPAVGVVGVVLGTAWQPGRP